MPRIGKSLMLSALAVSLVIGLVLAGGCTTPEPEPTQIILNLSSQQAWDLIQNNTNDIDFLIIDARTPKEFAEGHIEHAIVIDYNAGTFEEMVGYLDRNKTYLIYCDVGNRSGAALAVFEDLGFMEAYNMLDGINAWQADGLPIIQ
jgi:rhodanese-related sulfurtransferase|tara:strand:+ start:321 stop:758 length:438 start_codon:yes stop_codon:yes gene_type:complete